MVLMVLRSQVSSLQGSLSHFALHPQAKLESIQIPPGLQNELLSCYDFILIPGHTQCCNKAGSLQLDWTSLLLRPHYFSSLFFSTFPVLCIFSFSLPFLVLYIYSFFSPGSSIIRRPHSPCQLAAFLLHPGHNQPGHPLCAMLSTDPPLPESFQGAFVPLIPAADLGNQIPAHGFILAHPCHFYSLSRDDILISLCPGYS